MHFPDSISKASVPAYQPGASVTHHNLLGKRHTLLNHDSFHSLSKQVDANTSTMKRQKMTTHINTRHVALHFPHSTHTLEPTQISINFPLTVQESQINTRIDVPDNMEYTAMPVALELDVSMDDNAQSLKDYTSSSAALEGTRISLGNNMLVDTLDKLVLNDSNVSTCPTSHPRIEYEPSNATSQVASSDVLSDLENDIMDLVQVGFFERVQAWASTMQGIYNDRKKQLLYYELFGEKPALTANSANLLNLLGEIDQHKNQVTLQEEHVTNLAEEIVKVLKTCRSSKDQEIFKLATRILDNFYQRFWNRRFP